jgi:hypothetical protein
MQFSRDRFGKFALIGNRRATDSPSGYEPQTENA